MIGSPILICGAILFIALFIVLAAIWQTRRSLRQGALLVDELMQRGIRRSGRVRDAQAVLDDDGQIALQSGGAQMVLRIGLFATQERPSRVVSVHLVGNREAVRSLVGTEITVLEHPTHPSLCALEGHSPNGMRMGTLRTVSPNTSG